MKETVVPFTVTTYDAFCACMEKSVRAVYIYREVFQENAEKICQSLDTHGYEIWGLPTRDGMFFVKGTDAARCVIESTHF